MSKNLVTQTGKRSIISEVNQEVLKKKIGITTAVSNMLSLNYPYFAAYFKNKKQILYA